MSVREKCDEKESRQPSAISRQVVQLGVGVLAGPFSKSGEKWRTPGCFVTRFKNQCYTYTLEWPAREKWRAWPNASGRQEGASEQQGRFVQPSNCRTQAKRRLEWAS